MGTGLVKNFNAFANYVNASLSKHLKTRNEIKNINRKKNLYESIVLSSEQEKEIQNLFLKSYGKTISTKWHRLYTSYTGVFCANYFPEILFSTELEPITNPDKTAMFLGDKNWLPILFGGLNVHIPETYLCCINGIIFDKDRNPITKEKAVAILGFYKEFVIKKSIDTSSGRDVLIVHNHAGNSMDYLSKFGNNYVVQETIKQSKELSLLNPTSINTFRVMTYFCDGEIFVCPVALRMGRAHADRDNIHYGGISIGVNSDGTLKETAFSEYGDRFLTHPDTGITFKGYLIPEAGEMLRETAKKLHCNVPYLGILSWDLTIDENGHISLIEVNTIGQSAWFPQMVNGEPLFGNNTGKMLSRIKTKHR